MIASRTANRPKIGSTTKPRMVSPMNDASPTTPPSNSWPRTHLPKTSWMIPKIAQVSGRHDGGRDRSSAVCSPGRSLSRKNSHAGRIR